MDLSAATAGWFKQLLDGLAKEQARRDKLDKYLRGDPPLPPAPQRHKDAYERIWAMSRLNLANLITESVCERMEVVGFRTGLDGNDDIDSLAWRIWQANNLDADSSLVHRTKLALGDAYVLIGGVDERTGAPLITPEDPRQVITIEDPMNRRRTVAALKVFADAAAEIDRAFLFLAGDEHAWLHRGTRKRDAQNNVLSLSSDDWTWEAPEALSTRDVPVVRFANRADMFGRTLGEFEDDIDTLDRIHLMLLQRLVTAVVQAFRQRAIKGDLPEVDEDGNVIDYSKEFEFGPGSLWSLPEGVDIWESAGVDLTPLLESVKADIRDLAGSTRTPMFYLFPDAANGSAEGASLQREGLIFRTRSRIKETSDPWESVIRLALEVMGADAPADMETQWRPPEHFSLAEQHDANIKAAAGGVPWRTRMERILQFSPQDIERMERERDAEAAAGLAAVMNEMANGQMADLDGSL